MTLVIESLQAFVLDRPPIVAFFFSLIAITMTIFLVAFYIKEKDLVLDPHTQEDWNSLLKYINSKELCINMSNSDEPSSVRSETKRQSSGSTNSLDEMCFPVQINNMYANHSILSSLANDVRLAGHISLIEWIRSCTNHERQLEGNTNVTITLVVPAGLKNSKNTSCWVYLSGLPQLQLRNSNLCPTVHKQVPSLVTGKIYSYDFIKQQSNIKTNKTVCGSDELIQLSYISTPAPEVYLTKEDKLQIFSHLLHIGFAFLGILLLLLVSGVVQGRTLVLTRHHMLLPTKDVS